MYPTLCQHAFSIFSCNWVGNAQYLELDLEEPCFTGRHLSMTLSLGIPQLLVYVLGLPIMVLQFLARNRGAVATVGGSVAHHLTSTAARDADRPKREGGSGLFENPVVVMRWGLFFKSYKTDRFYWEIVITARKVSVVALSVFGKELGVQRQSQVALSLLLVCIVLEIVGRPFREASEDHSILKHLELS